MTELNTKSIALIYKMFTTGHLHEDKIYKWRIAVKVKGDVYSKGVYFLGASGTQKKQVSTHISVTKQRNLV